jgi:hypothetical protein
MHCRSDLMIPGRECHRPFIALENRPMTTTTNCSWCHKMGTPGTPCTDCGHTVGLSRMACDCHQCVSALERAQEEHDRIEALRLARDEERGGGAWE